MKRVPVLALLLVLAPLTWAEEVDNDAEFVPSTEVTTDVDSGGATVPSLPVETKPSATTGGSSAVPPKENLGAESPSVPSVTEYSSPHKVVKGDTLWDLAGAYLKDPFLWPKIFEANRDKIENPRWIFPDQEFVIPTVEAAERLSPPLPVVEAQEEVLPPPPAKDPSMAETAGVSEVPPPTEEMNGEGQSSKQMISPEEEVVDPSEDVDDRTLDEREAKKKRSQAVPGAGFMGGTADSFLADESWEYDGYVLRDRDQRMMISQGDVVFLNIGAASGVKPKMVAHVYRVGKKVKDPYLKKKTGRMVKRVGSVMVTGQVTDEGCTAVVTNSLEPIRIGDIVKFISR